jgi:hypothetical protein
MKKRRTAEIDPGVKSIALEDKSTNKSTTNDAKSVAR